MKKHSKRERKASGPKSPEALPPATGATPLDPRPPTADPLPRWLRFSPWYIVLAGLAVYFRVVGFDFVSFDDTAIIKDRYFIIGHLSNLKLAFTTDAFLGKTGSFYRPLQTVSFMVDAFFGGPGPLIYHLTNLILHIGASLCVFWLLLTLGYKHLLSLLLALLFVLHPMFVPMVAWVPTRGDLLLTIFVIVSFVLFIKSLRTNDRRLLLWHGAAFFLALLSKETAIAVPALCLIYYYYYFGFRKGASRGLCYQYIVVWAIAGGVWYYLHSLPYAGRLPPGDALGLTPLLKNLRILPELLGKFFVPMRFQLLPLFSPADTVIGVVAALLLAGLVVRKGAQSNRDIRLGLLWFLLGLLPVMIYRNPDAQYIFDYLYHRSYLPSVGLIVALAALLAKVRFPQERYARRLGFAALPILAYCGIASSHEVGYYNGALKFFTEASARTPKNALSYNNRGSYYGNNLQDYEAAVKDFNKAIEVFPAYLQAILNRGVTYEKLGRQQEALADLQAALKLKPNEPDTLFRLSDLEYLLNDYSSAVAAYNRLLAMDKMYPRIYSKRAGSEAMLGEAVLALHDAEEAIRIDPKDEEAYNSRGLANRLLGKLEEAKRDFDESISIKKDYSRPINNRGAIYLAQGDPEKALKDFDRAIQLDSRYADAYSNRGSVEHQLGKNDAALKDVETALRLNPTFADAYLNLGIIRMSLKSLPEALADYNRAIELNPKFTSAYLNRGILYTDHLDRFDAGIVDFRKVLELDPANTNATLNIGVALYKKKEFQHAIDQWSSLLKTTPSNAQLYHLRALAYAELHDYANAVKDATQAKNLGAAVDEKALASWQSLQNGK